MIAPYARGEAEVLTVFSCKMLRERGANIRVKSELNPDSLRVTDATLRGCSEKFTTLTGRLDALINN
jgi:hypothetical protein